MHKIIVTSSKPDKEGKAIAAMLHVLFPECEIRITGLHSESRTKSAATAQHGEFDKS
ncbi:hypothetical protein Dalk_2253 [Desulfatibacillum aliphaticivorans]|uniref:Uncharacterized protein n=1 Tax=Desulfatibacillum aliphaticivorans TaxID=218208 RepID=B8FIF6_DESAL|nr:hypothetical protein Dalk_2253 [Desulfatibacillum aliphaticivorans]